MTGFKINNFLFDIKPNYHAGFILNSFQLKIRDLFDEEENRSWSPGERKGQLPGIYFPKKKNPSTICRRILGG